MKTATQILKEKGLDFNLSLEDIWLCDVGKIKGKKAIVRTDTGDVFGIASTRYQPVGPLEAFAPLDKLTELYEINFKDVLSVGSGREIILEAEMGKDEMLKSSLNGNKDPLIPRIWFRMINDAKHAIMMRLGFFRVVCKNGLIIPDNKFSKQIRIPHIGLPQRKLEEAYDHFGNVKNLIAGTQLAIDTMKRVPMEKDLFSSYLLKLWKTDRGIQPSENRFDKVMTCWRSGNVDVKTDSVWYGYNSLVYYYDHVRQKNWDKIIQDQRSNLVGYYSDRKMDAFKLGLALANHVSRQTPISAFNTNEDMITVLKKHDLKTLISIGKEIHEGYIEREIEN